MKRCCRAILVSLVLVPLEARADNSFDPLADFPDPKAARKLLADGRALLRQGNYVEACPKLEESIRIEANVGAKFDLADCNDHVGKIASAWAGFQEVATDGAAANQAERKKEAMQRVLVLEKKLPKLVIEVPKAAPGLEIRRDGIVVEQAEWGTALPVDPGKHRVTAWLPGRTRWLTIVESIEGATTRVQVPADPGAVVESVARAAPSAATTVTSAPLPAPSPPALAPSLSASAVPAPLKPSRSASKIEPKGPTAPTIVDGAFWTRTNVGLVVGGAGLASLAAGAGFGLASLGSRGDATEYCRGSWCVTRAGSTPDDAFHNGDAAAVATAIGAVALAGALIMIFTAPKSAERTSRHGTNLSR